MIYLSLQRGLSLIELMIGILLSSLLLLGVLQIFQSNNDTLKMQNGFARVQESGRFAVDMFGREVRQAGFWGCAEKDDIGKLLKTDDEFLKNIGSNGILGVESASSTKKVGEKEVALGTDVLILSGAEDACGGKGKMLNGVSDSDVIVTENCPIEAGDIVLVSNCLSGSAFTVTGITVDGTSKNKKLKYEKGKIAEGWIENESDTFGLDKKYGADSKILTPYQRTFFISEGAPGSKSLFVQEHEGKPQELVPGVEDMQVSYGLDTTDSGIVDKWQIAGADDVMAKVVAVKIELVISSDSDSGANSQTITRLDGTSYEPDADGKLRKLYVATIKVRNRGSM
ncbi:PilW family protein [uncultured Microbulbifer sp.]|uniref:PilW family protein n=1 Tax=uncultured Microbulbifer sp. TaxID=348147 RepID=UPI00261C7534|nr:PilW family protein [uncultured Microbulbifer sp.]